VVVEEDNVAWRIHGKNTLIRRAFSMAIKRAV
jgi:hypothetical protein